LVVFNHLAVELVADLDVLGHRGDPLGEGIDQAPRLGA